MQPVIKWSGSKRSQAQEITSYIQKDYDTYYEPFCGSCAILAYIIEHENDLAKQFNRFVCSDLNKDLINSYNFIKYNPDKVINDYNFRWNEMNNGTNTIDDKKVYFNNIRERLNKNHDCSDFIFIMRTTVNGMPRYNKSGDFNNSFHVTREGITPDKFAKIVSKWSELLNKYDVQFVHQSYEKINCSKDDFVYLDPPYANTKGMYFGGFDKDCFFDFLSDLECDWMLSYDGISGNKNLVSEVPENLFKKHILIQNIDSSFKKVVGKGEDLNVQESLYLNFEPKFKLTLF